MRRYQVPLVHFLRRRGPDDEAEDVAQEAFIRAYENLARYRPRWRFSTWLFTIARRLSVSRRRRARPMADAAALESLAAAAPDPADAAAENESRRRLWDVAADVLGEEQVTALWLYYVEEMPVRADRPGARTFHARRENDAAPGPKEAARAARRLVPARARRR